MKALSDDGGGSRHQRFILRLGSGQALLVAHNIDLAPKVRSLEVGDTVGFSKEYEWNAKRGEQSIGLTTTPTEIMCLAG